MRSMSLSSVRSIVISLALLCAIAGCGFQLRGSYALPFASLHLSLPSSSELYTALRRNIEASSATRVVTEAKDADAVLSVISDSSQKSILSLNASGRAREFQLIRSFNFKLNSQKGFEYIPASQIVIRREITYSDDLVLSKEAEEVLIWRDIQTDLVQQLMRRLSAVKMRIEPKAE